MALVVDASVGLKWVLAEPDSHLAQALLDREPDLLLPDFWLHEATNVLCLQVRKGILTPAEAREALTLLRAVVPVTPTADMALHDVALDIGIAANHPTYDTFYLAFAIATGATAVIAADHGFVRSIRVHSDPALARMVLPLGDWARSRGVDR